MDKTIAGNKFSDHKKNIAFLLVFAVSLCWILFLPYTLRTHDSWFHLARIEAMVTAFKNGDWFPKIFPYMYEDFGYAISLFYSDFFMYIPALLTFRGINVLTSYKIYLALVIIATVFSAYYCANKLVNDKFSAVITAMVYAGSSYFAVDMFIRGALGESQAFIFLPFALLGMYNAVYGDENDRLPLIIGFGGLVLSHNLSLMLTAVLFAVFLVLNIAKLLKEPSRVFNIARSSITVVLTTAFFLLPMAEQLLTEEFFSSFHARIWNPGKAAIRIRNLFVGANLTEAPVFTPSLGITILIAIIICLALFFKKPKTDLHKFFTLLMLGLFACLFACTSLFPWWQLDPYLNIIQFPSRFYMYVTLFAAFCLGIWCSVNINELNNKKKAVITLVVAIICCVQFSFTTYQGWQIAVDEGRTITDTSALILWDENYLHANNNRQLWRERENYINTVRGVKSEVEAEMTRDYYNRYVSYSGNTTDNSLEIAAIYFRGYRAVDGETGRELEVHPSANGWLEVDIGAKESGTIVVDYYGTAVQHISPYITEISLILIVFRWGVKKKSKAGEKND